MILVGHSYGTYLGVEVARARPDLVRAFVGVGQVACTPAETGALVDAWAAQAAERAGDSRSAAHVRKGVSYDREAALYRYGGPVQGLRSRRELLSIGLRAPEYNGRDMLRLEEGLSYILPRFVRDGPSLPLWTSVRTLDVPTYLFEGRFDRVTPPACAERWLAGLQAPRKRLVWFERSAHYPFLEEPEAFRRELLKVARDTGVSDQMHRRLAFPPR